ncbi:DNA-binding protein [Oxalobacteraceae bacterium]|nr:DNA-binding protein [Oxalobacteraceae bacterium]
MAEGRYPSVDAVRVALGNTGSKTTIHKYLKQLDTEDGVASHGSSISDALQDLVERLAGRLKEEAEERCVEVEERASASARHHTEAMQKLRHDLETTQAQLQALTAAAETEKKRHAETQAALHAETVARHTAEQQVADLKERLAENEAHRRSLEEKHLHARDTLDHYRQSVQQQREQLAEVQKQAELRAATMENRYMETRLELAGQERETSLLNKELRRLQAIADQLQQEKTIWTQERVALEELARQGEEGA